MAENLRMAYTNAVPVEPLRGRLEGLSTDDAYAIQEYNTAHWLANGRRLVGRKIGLTSRAVQQQLGVDQPDFGMLFADMAMPEGEDIPAGRLLQPRIEAEIALILKRDLVFERHTYADLLQAVDCCLPALEIVDSRIANWDIRLADTIADNASSGLFVLGTRPVLLRDIDLTACSTRMSRSGETVSEGNGRACLGNPLNACLWLADTMSRYGRPLQAGDIVLTGALGPMVPVVAGDRFEASIDGLGSVSVGFGKQKEIR
ncbi:2-keto-4-pentenoate hydratase [Pararobbsia alpina]|nr:fumarylacetoacetate hydrolase family protein [Pararobbsia alpina]